MLYYKIKNTVYPNRKELKKEIGGINNYNRELRKGNIIFLADSIFDSCHIKYDNINNKHHSYYENQSKL